MSAQSTTLSIRVPTSVAEDLKELAALTDRSKSALSAHAIKAYVAHELEICRGIQAGLDDVKAGRVVSHEEAMARVQATIDGKYAKRKMG